MSRNENIKESHRDPEAMLKKSLHSGKETVKLGTILCIICVISAGLLAFIYGLTKDRIANQKKTEQMQVIEKVLSAATSIEEKNLDDLVYFIGYDKDKKEVGLALIVEAKGYSGLIETCVGLNRQGEIIALEILSHSETPGLGSKISDKAFLSKFKDRAITDIGKADAITGATISSSAVINSVKQKAEELLNKLSQK